VGTGEQPHLSPRKLSLLNTHSNSIIQNLSFPSSVLGVQLNRKRCEQPCMLGVCMHVTGLLAVPSPANGLPLLQSNSPGPSH
jgi:hypothetical protein